MLPTLYDSHTIVCLLLYQVSADDLFDPQLLPGFAANIARGQISALNTLLAPPYLSLEGEFLLSAKRPTWKQTCRIRLQLVKLQFNIFGTLYSLLHYYYFGNNLSLLHSPKYLLCIIKIFICQNHYIQPFVPQKEQEGGGEGYRQ